MMVLRELLNLFFKIHKEGEEKRWKPPSPSDPFMRPQPAAQSRQLLFLLLRTDGVAIGTYHRGLETLGVLDVHSLDVRKQPVLRTLLVVTLARDTDAKSVGDTLDSLLPDLLVELGVETDILSSLSRNRQPSSCNPPRLHPSNFLSILLSHPPSPVIPVE
jgi:hypothetical protein